MRKAHYIRITAISLMITLALSLTCYAEEGAMPEELPEEPLIEETEEPPIEETEEQPEDPEEPEQPELPQAGVEEIFEGLEIEPIETPDITEVFKDADTVHNEEPAEHHTTVAEAVEDVQPAHEEHKEEDSDVGAAPEEQPSADEDKGNDNGELIQILTASVSSSNAMSEKLTDVSMNMAEIRAVLDEQRILLEGIKEQLSKDSRRDARHQEEVIERMVAIASSVSVDVAKGISLDEIKVTVSVDRADDTVSEDETDGPIPADRLHTVSAAGDSVLPVLASEDGIRTVSASNISGNISGQDISDTAEYLRNIFYVMVVIAIFLAMITAMMIEQLIFKRLHG